MFTIAYLFFILFFSGVIGLGSYVFHRLGRGWSLKNLLKDFKRKIFMTIGLGGVFLSFYLLIIAFGHYFARDWGQDLFLLVYKNPVAFVYGGLCAFASCSLAIYLVRMIIKYVFLTRGRDN